MRYVFPLRQSHFGGASRLVTVLKKGLCIADIITSPLIVTFSRSQWSTPLCPFEDIGGFVYQLSKNGNFRVACGVDPILSCVHHVF